MEMINNVQDMFVQKNGETQILPVIIIVPAIILHTFLETKTKY
jgi:hypothetical protein